MKILHKPLSCTLIFMLAVVVLSSCLSDSGNSEFSSQLTVGLELENINDSVIAGEDTLEIEILKFIHGNSFLLNDASDTLLFKEDPQIIGHQLQDQNIKLLAQGVIPAGIYGQMEFDIALAPSSVETVDSDFADADTTYSMVIAGTYNDSTFTFRSPRDFTSMLTITPPLDIPDANTRFEIILSTDVRGWFLGEDGQSLINPADTAGVTAINNNIEGSIQVKSAEQATN